jgi:hypothetical protein
MADTKDTDIAPDELDGLAAGTGHGVEADLGHSLADGSHGAHLDGAHGVGGSHSK